MKTLIIALTAAGVALAGTPTDSFAGKKQFKKSGKSYLGHSQRRRFTQRDYDRLPIRTTRPPNSARYRFQDYPLWAARAFESPSSE